MYRYICRFTFLSWYFGIYTGRDTYGYVCIYIYIHWDVYIGIYIYIYRRFVYVGMLPVRCNMHRHLRIDCSMGEFTPPQIKQHQTAKGQGDVQDGSHKSG